LINKLGNIIYEADEKINNMSYDELDLLEQKIFEIKDWSEI